MGSPNPDRDDALLACQGHLSAALLALFDARAGGHGTPEAGERAELARVCRLVMDAQQGVIAIVREREVGER